MSAVGAKTLEELRAWQAARAFKLEVYRLIKQSPSASSDYRFRSQLSEAACGGEINIAEGFRRYAALEFAHFLAYAVASMEEAVRRVQDGIDRDYFIACECERAFELGRAAGRTTTALQTSLRNLSRIRTSERARREPRTQDRSRTKERDPTEH
jgi:four helix bundle protein